MSVVQEICVAHTEVKRLRRKLRRAKHDFRCIKKPLGAAEKCAAFNSNMLCANQDCKNYDWAKSYINLVARLDKARKVRNDLLVEHFWVCRKYCELRVYQDLSRQAELKRREAFHQFCRTLYDTAQKNDEELKLAHDAYEAAVEQCNAARAKLFGRDK